MKTRKNFEEPKLNVIKFEAADIITASGEDYSTEYNPTPELEEWTLSVDKQ